MISEQLSDCCMIQVARSWLPQKYFNEASGLKLNLDTYNSMGLVWQRKNADRHIKTCYITH